MKPAIQRKSVILICLVAISGILGAAQAQEAFYQEKLQGATFRAPEGKWKRTSGTRGASRYVMFESQEEEGTKISLQVWSGGSGDRSLRQWCESELKFEQATHSTKQIRQGKRTVAGLAAEFIRFRRGSGASGQEIDSTYLARNGVVYRISVAIALTKEDLLPGLVKEALEGLEWSGKGPEKKELVPFKSKEPIQGNVLTTVRANGKESAYRYLEALPGAARQNGGLPVVLVVGERLGESARIFLAKYRPERILIVGGPHPELPQAEEARDEWKQNDTVVVTEKTLESAIPSAALASRMSVPLLVSGPDLPSRLQKLNPARILVVGSVELPGGFDGEALPDPIAVARRAGGGSYIAMCNVGDGPGRETAVFAAPLAAVHEGVVLPISERVRTYRCPLIPTETRPEGLEASEEGRYVTGTFQVEDRKILVAAPVEGHMRISGAASDRYGRPRIDLDGNGRLDGENEKPKIGSTVQINGRSYAFSIRFQTALGHPGRGEALLMEPDSTRIRKSIRSFVECLGSAEHLAIVGTPARIPFAILEAETYFCSIDIKQEMASDAPYANLDEDPSLELAVGRVLPADLEEGSVILAASLAYGRFEGEWISRASLLAPGFPAAEGRKSLHWVWPESESLARGIAGDLREAGVHCEEFLRDQVNVDEVLASMSKAGWIGHMNHSNEMNWGIRPGVHIRSADLPALEGAPIVLDTGCSSAGVDLRVPLPETLPGRFFALGAVAYLGNTRPASLGSEVAVKQMFSRLTSGEATLGQAYREGRNLLAHLLMQGDIDPELGTWVFDPGVYKRMWSQFYILNLYGDPGLKPRLPKPAQPPLVDVRLEETSLPDRLRLTVSRKGKERIDPVLILAAPGQGTPREAFLHTAPGLSYGIVPHFYLDGKSLSPLRSHLAAAPGAWIDVELPRLGQDVRVELVRGAPWADRGFSIEGDPGGEARLRMYVPFVRKSLEKGEGEILSQVVFNVIFSGPSGATPSPLRAPKMIHGRECVRRLTAIDRVSPEARPILKRVQKRRYDPIAQGMFRLDFSVPNPSPGTLGEARFRAAWARGKEALFEVSDLPQRMASHQRRAEEAFGFLFDLVVNNPFGSILSRGYSVDLDQSGNGETILVLERVGGDEGSERIHLVVSEEGRIERMQHRRFGVEDVICFDWQETPEGDILLKQTTEDVRYGQPRIIELCYGDPIEGFRLPSSIIVQVPGLIARPFEFHLQYERVQGARR